MKTKAKVLATILLKFCILHNNTRENTFSVAHIWIQVIDYTMYFEFSENKNLQLFLHIVRSKNSYKSDQSENESVDP